MLIPSTRLILWATLLVPLALAGPLSPILARYGWLYFACLVVVALVDGVLAVTRRALATIALPPIVRLSRRRQGSIPIRIDVQHLRPENVRVGLPLPPGLATETDYLDVEMPPDSGSANVAWECKALHRGQYRLDHAYLEMASALGLWSVRSVSDCDCELRIYPDLSLERSRLASLFLNRDGYGMHSQRTVGQGREFERLRDYLPGDSYGDIHWKATARRGRPVTKLFQIERTQEVVVAVDSSRLTGRKMGEDPLLERFLTTALVLGQVAHHQGDQFGLITFNSKVTNFVRPGSGHAHYGVCRDAIYTSQPVCESPDFDELFAFVRQRMARRSLLVILTDLSDPMIAEGFCESVRLVCRHHLVLVVMIQPDGAAPLFEGDAVQTTDEIYEHLGGHIRWQKLCETQQQLHHQGITMRFVRKELLTNEAISQYMNIKARQSL